MREKKTQPVREKGYILHHGLRTAKLTLHIAEGISEAPGVEQDVLFASGLFHDVGKGKEPHNETGALLVKELLRDECTENQLTAIARIVCSHNQRAKPNEHSIATKIIQDADILDHFGVQNVWLAFHWNTHHEESQEQSVAFYNSDENKEYLVGCRETLNFDFSRAAFDRRIAFERKFFDRLAGEINGEL